MQGRSTIRVTPINCKQACSHAKRMYENKMRQTETYELLAKFIHSYLPDYNRINEAYLHREAVDKFRLFMVDEKYRGKDVADRVFRSYLFMFLKWLSIKEYKSFKKRVIVLVGESGCGKTSFTNAIAKMVGLKHVEHVSLENKKESDIAFALGECLGKRLVVFDDVLTTGWHTIIEQLRNHMDGNIVQFNQKYGRKKTGVFPRIIITTNMTKDQVLAMYGEHGYMRDMAKTSMNRIPIWIKFSRVDTSINIHADEMVHLLRYSILDIQTRLFNDPRKQKRNMQCSSKSWALLLLQNFTPSLEKNQTQTMYWPSMLTVGLCVN